jgi:hypothetical protein
VSKSPIDLSNTPRKLPTIDGSDFVESGCVFVDDHGSRFATDDQRIVLERTGAKPLELRTRSTLTTRLEPDIPPVTLLSPGDFDTIKTGSGEVTARLYRPIRDRLRKLWSGAGVVLLLPALLAVVAAVLSILAVVMAAPADSTADRQQALLAWATQPLARIGAGAAPVTMAQADDEVRTRVIAAQWCELSMLGHPVSSQFGQRLIQPGLNRQTVVAGDTLWTLANDNYGGDGDARTETLVALVAAANNIADPNWITVGQVIDFPSVRSALALPVSCAHTAPSWLQKFGFALFGGCVAFLTSLVASGAAWLRCGFQQTL